MRGMLANRAVLEILNGFFFGFHTLLILFNCLGWIPRKTRRWNLLTQGLTFLSWFGLGVWYGWGYCFCTDWHWAVREALGYATPTASYTGFLFASLTGLEPDPALVNALTVSVFFASLGASAFLNARDWLVARRRSTKA